MPRSPSKPSRYTIVFALALACTSCAADLQEQIDTLRGQLYLLATNALCPEEVQTLMREVTRTCETHTESVCTDQRISFLISQVDPGGRFFTLMSSQPYAVFYADPKKQGKDLYWEASQKRRLQQLTQPPWLPSTRFLVVANIDRGGDISNPKYRAGQMVDALLKMEFPGYPKKHIDKSQVLGWVFRFKLQEGEFLRPLDRPPLRGTNVENSVWVFRTDCRHSAGDATMRQKGS